MANRSRFYSDKHGIFRVNRKEAAVGDGVTQFGRALLALNIDIICANYDAVVAELHLRLPAAKILLYRGQCQAPP